MPQKVTTGNNDVQMVDTCKGQMSVDWRVGCKILWLMGFWSMIDYRRLNVSSCLSLPGDRGCL